MLAMCDGILEKQSKSHTVLTIIEIIHIYPTFSMINCSHTSALLEMQLFISFHSQLDLLVEWVLFKLWDDHKVEVAVGSGAHQSYLAQLLAI